MTPQHQVQVNEALGWSRCVCVCRCVVCGRHESVCVGCVRLWVNSGYQSVHQGDTMGGEQHLSLRKKAGKQDATLTQETWCHR